MEDILQNVKVVGKNETLKEAGQLVGKVGLNVAGAAIGVTSGKLDGNAIGKFLANIIFKRIYKVRDFCVIHNNPLYKDNPEITKQVEDILNGIFEKGYFREVLAKLRAALEDGIDRGQLTVINEDKDIFTDVELAYYILSLTKIKNKDIRMIYTVYYERKYYWVFGKWGMGLVKNIHKNIEFKVKTMKSPACTIL